MLTAAATAVTLRIMPSAIIAATILRVHSMCAAVLRGAALLGGRYRAVKFICVLWPAAVSSFASSALAWMT